MGGNDFSSPQGTRDMRPIPGVNPRYLFRRRCRSTDCRPIICAEPRDSIGTGILNWIGLTYLPLLCRSTVHPGQNDLSESWLSFWILVGQSPAHFCRAEMFRASGQAPKIHPQFNPGWWLLPRSCRSPRDERQVTAAKLQFSSFVPYWK